MSGNIGINDLAFPRTNVQLDEAFATDEEVAGLLLGKVDNVRVTHVLVPHGLDGLPLGL